MNYEFKTDDDDDDLEEYELTEQELKDLLEIPAVQKLLGKIFPRVMRKT